MSKLGQNSSEKREEKQLSFLQTVKQLLFLRSYTLITSLKLSFSQAIILIIIQQFQKISIITRYTVNPTLLKSPQMHYVVQFSRVFLLDVFPIDDSRNLIITTLLILGQVLMLLVIIVPFKGERLNQILSKYILTFLNMILTYPSIVLSVHFMVEGVNIGPNVILYIFALSTNLLYESMQLQCSFQRQNQNLLVRTPRPITFKVASLLIISVFPILTKLMYPMSFTIYSLFMLAVQLYNWTFYLHKFIYFHELFMYIKGVMLTIHISANLCYLCIYMLANQIISQNILLFIITFSFFLGNFFITYRKYILKNTIINKDLKGENEIGLYCVFYWHCFAKITEKKNQLYVSSLLKKHTNECLDLSCCCKNRQYLYDTYLKSFGNPNIQPHFDKIFIRHFIRKMLCDGYEKFNKSSILALLLSNYNIEVVEMITQTMELVRKLSKLQQKKQLYFTEQFLLFCLKMKTKNKIISINFKRGNVDLESVKQFDERLTVLNHSLRSSIKIYHSLWKQLQSTRLNEAVLYDICKNNLQLMFSIEKNYKQIKNINTESSQLRAIMLFYSRLVLHDIHLLSEVRKDIRNGHERNGMLSTLQLSNIQLFGNNTATIISLENARIKWSSKNAFRLFQYTKEEFHNLTIKNLMPRHFAEKHDSYIERWKTTGHHIKLNKTTYLWGNCKSGSCFSMLMFVKVIPLPHEQQYAFFSCMQKLDDSSQLICSSYGEVYGSGKLFTKMININPKYLQEIKMNIQVFVPQTFDYFLEYFYPKNTKLKSIKRNFQVRREGYFPQNLNSVLKQLHDERKSFLKRYQKSQFFSKQYLNFVRQQMQELTCSVNGQYISVSIVPFKTYSFQRQEQNIVVLKISNPKKDSIEKYYAELEKTISKLQLINEEETSKGSKSIFKKSKSDFFKVFLNPKRMKRLLKQEQDEANSIPGQQSEQFKKATSRELKLKSKPRESLIAHRKMLALGARIEIKSDRVRYNIFKMKKILLEEGVISRYTYNILIGKHSNHHFLAEHHSDKVEQADNDKTFKDLQQQRNISEQQKDSIQHDSDEQLAANKQNDNETFNSASSSATFISMTNHVKLFKLKLRSLNTPRILLMLNITILIVLSAGIVSLIYLTSQNIGNLSIGIKQFENNEQANLILDSLYLGQANINNIHQYPNNSQFRVIRSHFLESVSTLYKQQMFLRAQYKQIDPNILSYLSLTVTDQQTLTVTQFIGSILDQIISNRFNHVIIYFQQSKVAIAHHSLTNLFFNRIRTNLFSFFVVTLVAIIALFALTLPIVYKLKIKIKEIYDLLSKISTNDRAKYFKHFSLLNDQFKKKEEIEYAELNNITTAYENRFKQLKNNNTKSMFSQESFRAEPQRQKDMAVAGAQEESSISTDRRIYFKIAVIYFILIASVIFNYIFVNSYHKTFMSANDEFIRLFNAKTNLTSRIVEGQYEMMGYPHETEYSSSIVELVDIIHKTYSLPDVSSSYKSYVFKFVTQNPCKLISNRLTPDRLLFCSKINNNTFTQGGIDNLYYSQRKIEQRVNEYYAARNFTQNNEKTIAFPPYFQADEYIELVVGYHFSTMMVYDLYAEAFRELNRFASSYRLQLYVALGVCLSLIVAFTACWVLMYLRLAENASYINAFLLLIPFDVLSENPYIKLYIKNEFDYKTSY